VIARQWREARGHGRSAISVDHDAGRLFDFTTQNVKPRWHMMGLVI
jgi:hypothetical protein